jgi:hypothetical protein
MIYYNIINDKKVFFESDIIFADYEATLANAEEQKEYFLQKAKDKKLADLNKFYNSSECWTYTVYTDVKQYASLTKDADFFAKLLPSCGGKQIQVFDDNNVIIQYDLSVEKANNLNYQINAINGILVKAKTLDLGNRINLATNIDDIINIDYQKELLNAVERKINLDSIK